MRSLCSVFQLRAVCDQMFPRRRRNVRLRPGRIVSATFTLAVGLVVGWGGTIMYNGMKSGDPDGMGAGLKQLFTDSQESEVANVLSKRATSTAPVRASFEFYTVLPDVERVVSIEETTPQTQPSQEPVKPSVKNQDSNGYYMLQVGSYSKQSIAEKMKANLAITGFEPAIQRVSIQGQGQLFRVQVGPFATMGQLGKANRKLEQMGFKTLWLKVSKRP